MSATLTTGLQESQASAQKSATADRTTHKCKVMKWAKPVALILFAVTLLDWGVPIVKNWWNTPSSQSSVQPGKVGEEMVTRTKRGESYKTTISVPRDEMGVVKTSAWSEWLEIPAGCGTAFAHGNGTLFEMEGKLYGGQPFVAPPGDSFPPASHVRSRILPAGEATFGGSTGKVPITIKC